MGDGVYILFTFCEFFKGVAGWVMFFVAVIVGTLIVIAVIIGAK